MSAAPTPQPQTPPAAEMTRRVRRWAIVLFVDPGLGALGWWWAMPGGFPVDHPRFWANRVVPILFVVVAAAGIWSLGAPRHAIARALLLSLAGVWLATALSWWLYFPHSARRIGIATAVLAALSLWAAWGAALRTRKFWKLALPLLVAALALGAALPRTQRAAAPSTRPLNVPLPELVSDRFPWEVEAVAVDRGVFVDPRVQSVDMIRTGDGDVPDAAVSIRPLLTFISRSPDRCWTNLAPRRHRLGPRRRLSGVTHAPGVVEASYVDDGGSWMRISSRRDSVNDDDGGADVQIDAVTTLPAPVYSHLNSFCQITFAGGGGVSLTFSPCPETRVDVLPSGYPVGRPRRIAFVDAAGAFHIVEASSGEKGPFRTLARGTLGRSDPLEIVFHVGAEPRARVVLEDWSAQAGTALSPTAGWGLPVNAIEFTRAGRNADAPAQLYITLAGTSVGRGWDSVGHAAGTYRNRMRVEWVGADEE